MKLFRRRKATVPEGAVTPADVFRPDSADEAGPDTTRTDTSGTDSTRADTTRTEATGTDRAALAGGDAAGATPVGSRPDEGSVRLVDPGAPNDASPDPTAAEAPGPVAVPSPAVPVPVVPTAGASSPPPGLPAPSDLPASSDLPAPSDRPVMRFGFGDHADIDARAAGSVVPGPADAGPGTDSSSSGDRGAVATKPRKIVSIGFDTDLEDVETTSFDPSPVEQARPEVEPRMRARRIQVRRDAGRRRLRWVVVGGVVLLLLVGAGIVLDSPLFAVNDVEVTGATYTNRARLQSVVDDLDGSTLLGAKLGKAQQALAADPWVERVRVERRPLRGIRIEIVERSPSVTYVGADQHWRVLDSTGKVLTVLSPAGSKPVDPLELTPASPGPDLAAGANAPAAYAAAADLVPRLPPSLRTLTCSMQVAADGSLTMELCNRYQIVLGSADQLRDKLITAMYLLTAQQAKLAGTKAMNVSDPFHAVLIPK